MASRAAYQRCGQHSTWVDARLGSVHGPNGLITFSVYSPSSLVLWTSIPQIGHVAVTLIPVLRVVRLSRRLEPQWLTRRVRHRAAFAVTWTSKMQPICPVPRGVDRTSPRVDTSLPRCPRVAVLVELFLTGLPVVQARCRRTPILRISCFKARRAAGSIYPSSITP